MELSVYDLPFDVLLLILKDLTFRDLISCYEETKGIFTEKVVKKLCYWYNVPSNIMCKNYYFENFKNFILENEVYEKTLELNIYVCYDKYKVAFINFIDKNYNKQIFMNYNERFELCLHLLIKSRIDEELKHKIFKLVVDYQFKYGSMKTSNIWTNSILRCQIILNDKDVINNLLKYKEYDFVYESCIKGDNDIILDLLFKKDYNIDVKKIINNILPNLSINILKWLIRNNYLNTKVLKNMLIIAEIRLFNFDSGDFEFNKTKIIVDYLLGEIG